MLYFAYGSNLNVEQMGMRCPEAVPITKFKLDDARLVFRGVADCIYEPGAVCHGGIWKITPRCEVALDRYEGIAGGMYRKEVLQLAEPIEDETELMLYVMNSTGIMPPPAGYLAIIRRGYRDFKLPQRALDDAVRASWDDKHPSHVERRRHQRNGRPKLAPKPENRNAGPGKTPAKSGV